MSKSLARLAFATALATAAFAASAQQQQNPRDVVPDKMPFDTPYGPPITLARAQQAINAAIAEAQKRGWKMNMAVFDSGANLVAFARMDGAQLGSIQIAEHKARAAIKYRRETKAFESGIQEGNLHYLLTLDDVIASRGGIPIVDNGQMIGAVGCSGGTGSQDEVVCRAGADAVKR
jgi:glc operon protein GlcG